MFDSARRLAVLVVGLGLASAAASAQVSSLDYLLTGEMNIPESGLAPIDPPRTFEASGSFLPSDTFDVPTRFEGEGGGPTGQFFGSVITTRNVGSITSSGRLRLEAGVVGSIGASRGPNGLVLTNSAVSSYTFVVEEETDFFLFAGGGATGNALASAALVDGDGTVLFSGTNGPVSIRPLIFETGTLGPGTYTLTLSGESTLQGLVSAYSASAILVVPGPASAVFLLVGMPLLSQRRW